MPSKSIAVAGEDAQRSGGQQDVTDPAVRELQEKFGDTFF
jgi:pyruvate/2-oxoglutarate/acetoin dehydrogenase E1 component